MAQLREFTADEGDEPLDKLLSVTRGETQRSRTSAINKLRSKMARDNHAQSCS